MTRLIGITKSAPGDWKLTDLGWIFSIAIVLLGVSAAIAGTWLDRAGPRKAMFTAAYCFGGGFLISAFGVKYVGAIHGRLLTAWSAAGVFGPVIVNYMRQYLIDHGAAKADAYTDTMYIMAGLLLIGLICNVLMRPVHERHLLTPQTAGI